MRLLADNLMVVLHQIRSPDNLGAVARVMANFGFAGCILSDPPTYCVFDERPRIAVKAAAVLDGCGRGRTLEEALADCVFVVWDDLAHAVKGRTALLTPEEAVSGSWRRRAGAGGAGVRGRAAGLSDEELEQLPRTARHPHRRTCSRR